MATFLERVRGSRPDHYEEAYDETSLWASRFGALLLDEVPLSADVDGLDIACGTGFPLIELAQSCGPSSRWVGVDIWNEALDRARRKIEILGVTNARAEYADAAALPFDDASFDLVVSNLGINNFEEPAVVALEIARVMRPKATLAVTTNVTGHMRELYALFRDVLRDHSLEQLLPALAEQEAHRGSIDSIATLFEGAGLHVTRTVKRSFHLRFANGTALMRHSLVQWFLDGWRGVTGPEHEAAILGEIERRLNEQAQRGALAFTVDAVYIEAAR